ncbi:site-specific integrase [Alkalicoccus saliphilus]|uniref:Site-specific integrase n=2 Tax=Alkalicoccus saliphilus TaxID=200989 RepID=A0A2T4U822_9BACI|nr:site-specific integrase [Alkalicoccus saliphilus]
MSILYYYGRSLMIKNRKAEKGIFLSEEEYSRLENKLGKEEVEARIARLSHLKKTGGRPEKLKSDFQALLAMGARPIDPLKSTAQIESMKRMLTAPRDLFLFDFGINTGLALGEMLQLTAGDVRGKKELFTKKNGTRVPLNKSLRNKIFTYTASMENEEYLFSSSKTKKPLQRDRANKILKSAAEQAGLQKVGAHTLRKTFGYHFYKRYGDASFLQELFNHSSHSVTLKYIGVLEEETASAMEEFSL